jgi:hypothetical protein
VPLHPEPGTDGTRLGMGRLEPEGMHWRVVVQVEHCIVWTGLLTVLLFAAAGGAAAAEPWRAVDQPELKQALERAPVLIPESLGEPARGVNT